MDTLSFLANIIEHLAWPTSTVVVVLLVRKELKTLLSLVRRVKAGPVEAEFEREVAALAAKEPEAKDANQTIVANRPERLALFQIAEASPRAAIMDAWANIERSVGHAVSRTALYVPEREAAHPSAAFRALANAKLLEPDWITRYYELRGLRNRAAHDEETTPSRESAYAFIELSFRLIALLESISKSASNA